MKGSRLGLIAAACAALAAGGAGLGAQEPFEWSGRVAQGGTLEVKGISGSIRTELARNGTARVTATKRGRQSDFDEVEIRMEQEGDDVVICAIYGSWNRSDGCDSHGDSDEGRGWRRNRSIDVSVDYVVQLPAGTRFHGALVTGDVEVAGVRSDVEAGTVTGDITISTTGVARASTVSGSVDVTMGSQDWDELDFNTVSGDITLRMPAALDAEVEFQSLSGDLESDFDMKVTQQRHRRWVGERIRATIGDGGRSLSFNTVSGDVRLLRAG